MGSGLDLGGSREPPKEMALLRIALMGDVGSKATYELGHSKQSLRAALKLKGDTLTN